MAMNGIAVVTGGVRIGNIGSGIVEYFRAQGIDVYNPTRPALDVRDIASVRKAFTTIAENGPIRLLVNCAAVSVSGPWVSDNEWNQILQTNVMGTANCCQIATEHMRNGGTIVNMSSVVARWGLENGAAYAASKAAVEAWTKSFAKEVGAAGITCNALQLGYFDCGLIRDVPEKTRDAIIRRTPVGRLGRAEEVAAMCLYLDTARFVTGAVIAMDGGL